MRRAIKYGFSGPCGITEDELLNADGTPKGGGPKPADKKPDEKPSQEIANPQKVADPNKVTIDKSEFEKYQYWADRGVKAYQADEKKPEVKGDEPEDIETLFIRDPKKATERVIEERLGREAPAYGAMQQRLIDTDLAEIRKDPDYEEAKDDLEEMIKRMNPTLLLDPHTKDNLRTFMVGTAERKRREKSRQADIADVKQGGEHGERKLRGRELVSSAIADTKMRKTPEKFASLSKRFNGIRAAQGLKSLTLEERAQGILDSRDEKWIDDTFPGGVS